MMDQKYGFVFNDKDIRQSAYGSDYLSSLIGVLERCAPQGAKNILEWGSGLTTQVLADFALKWKSELLLSIDENAAYQKAIFAQRTKPECLTLKVIDLIGPGQSQRDPEFNFSTYPLAMGRKFDVIFIDARRRMECAFIASLLSHKDTIVIIHDYRRTRYQPIVALFEIIEDGPQYRVLRPRVNVLEALAAGSQAVEMYVKCLEFNSIGARD